MAGTDRARWKAAVAVGCAAVILAVLGVKLVGPALGQATTVRVISPGTASVGASVAVGIDVENVTNLGAYEWVLTYDPDVLELPMVAVPVNGTFLGSTGRSPFCPPPILDVGSVRFGCVSSGSAAAPSGGGSLSTVTFTARASGSSSLCLKWATLSDAYGDDIPTGVTNGSIAVGGGSPPAPSCPPAATPTPAGPAATSTPGLILDTPVATATITPGPPAPTATPTGPTPTPAPTPPPESAEVMNLIAGCNPLATTYADGTTVQTLTGATSPAGTLKAIWKFDAGVWRGYSPEFPQASDLALTSFLDVVFLCVDAPGTFVRPRV